MTFYSVYKVIGYDEAQSQLKFLILRLLCQFEVSSIWVDQMEVIYVHEPPKGSFKKEVGPMDIIYVHEPLEGS